MSWDDDGRPVSPERSGWRDEAISRRHREWGFNLPFADIDFLVCEYDRCRVAALIEYKNWKAKQISPQNPNIVTMRDLADRAQTPFFAVRYSEDLSTYYVVPLNYLANNVLAERTLMSELEYVTFLYKLRGRAIPLTVAATIGAREAA
jgi:hypothetical protein